MTVALRRSLPASRRTVTKSRPAPKSPSVVGSRGSGSRPDAPAWPSAASAPKVTASTKQRAPTRSATAALDRTGQLRRVKHVDDDAARGEMRDDLWRRRRDAHRKHAVVRAA